jgi:hypothetical protein
LTNQIFKCRKKGKNVMKNNLLQSILLVCIISGITQAQTIFSNGTGGGLWSDPSTWQGGVVPDINDDVFIAGTDSVNTAAGAQCNSLSVLSGGRFATSIDTVQVAGLLTIEDDAWFYNATSEPELPGNSYDIYPQSYVVHSGSGTVGGDNNSEFGNLVIVRNEGTVPGADLTINGNLIIRNGAANIVFRGVRPATGSQTHTVYGDVYIYKGTLSCIDVGDNTMVGIWNFLGNVYVIDDGPTYLESRIGCFSSANAAGLGIINISGDLILQGGRLQAGTSSSPGPGVAIFNVGGNVSADINSAVSTNSLGPFAMNFVGSGTQTINMDVRFQMSTSVYDTVKTGSSVVFDLDTNRWGSSVGGDFVVNGSLELRSISRLDGLGNFIHNPGATLKIGSLDGLTSSGTTGNIQVTGTRTFSSDATYEYKGNGTQSLGDALPNPLFGFGVNNPTGITLDRDLSVNGVVNIINGDLELNGHNVTLGSNAMLTETSGNTVKGLTGKISISTDLNAPAGVNVGGLGAWISSGSNLGNTTVERYHSPRSGSGNQGILRYFNIAPANNTGLNATFRLYYDESEIGSVPEANLRLFKSPDGTDNTWSIIGGVVSSSSNYVEAYNIEDFSYWTLADMDHPLPVEDEITDEQIPSQYALYQNYPNPFNPETIIKFDLPEPGNVELKLFNTLGEEVMVILNEQLQAGTHRVNLNAGSLPSGVYVYKLITNSLQFSNKMILLK